MRACGGHGTPPGRRHRHALATRHGVPDAVGRGAREEKTARGWTGPWRASWAEAKAGERAAGAEAGRAACAAGPKARRRPTKEKMKIFNLNFQEIFNTSFSNIILSKKMTSFENGPKMKVD